MLWYVEYIYIFIYLFIQLFIYACYIILYVTYNYVQYRYIYMIYSQSQSSQAPTIHFTRSKSLVFHSTRRSVDSADIGKAVNSRQIPMNVILANPIPGELSLYIGIDPHSFCGYWSFTRNFNS